MAGRGMEETEQKTKREKVLKRVCMFTHHTCVISNLWTMSGIENAAASTPARDISVSPTCPVPCSTQKEEMILFPSKMYMRLDIHRGEITL